MIESELVLEDIHLEMNKDQHTVFNKKINVYLLQSDPHAGALDISEHHKFDVRGRFVVMELILTRVVGDETIVRILC